MKAQRWGEPKGKAITQFQAALLTRLAKQRLGFGWQAQFRFWLTCHGYYTIKHPERECPLYVGTTLVIPESDYESVKKELTDVPMSANAGGGLTWLTPEKETRHYLS